MSVEYQESNEHHQKLIKEIKKHTENEWISTPELATTVDRQGYTPKYIRYSLLPVLLKHLHEEDVLERDERAEGGNQTHYWRLRK